MAVGFNRKNSAIMLFSVMKCILPKGSIYPQRAAWETNSPALSQGQFGNSWRWFGSNRLTGGNQHQHVLPLVVHAILHYSLRRLVTFSLPSCSSLSISVETEAQVYTIPLMLVILRTRVSKHMDISTSPLSAICKDFLEEFRCM